jgi:hypothetical protein
VGGEAPRKEPVTRGVRAGSRGAVPLHGPRRTGRLKKHPARDPRRGGAAAARAARAGPAPGLRLVLSRWGRRCVQRTALAPRPAHGPVRHIALVRGPCCEPGAGSSRQGRRRRRSGEGPSTDAPQWRGRRGASASAGGGGRTVGARVGAHSPVNCGRQHGRRARPREPAAAPRTWHTAAHGGPKKARCRRARHPIAPQKLAFSNRKSANPPNTSRQAPSDTAWPRKRALPPPTCIHTPGHRPEAPMSAAAEQPAAAPAAAAPAAGAPAAGALDRALGCVLGAAVGDAAGGPLEFMGRAPTDSEVRRAVWDTVGGLGCACAIAARTAALAPRARPTGRPPPPCRPGRGGDGHARRRRAQARPRPGGYSAAAGCVPAPAAHRAHPLPPPPLNPPPTSQFTDDTEMALCLGRGLAGHDPGGPFPLDSVAQQYGAWLASHPFDVGAAEGRGKGGS